MNHINYDYSAVLLFLPFWSSTAKDYIIKKEHTGHTENFDLY